MYSRLPSTIGRSAVNLWSVCCEVGQCAFNVDQSDVSNCQSAVNIGQSAVKAGLPAVDIGSVCRQCWFVYCQR